MLGRYLARPPFGGKGWIQPDLYTHVLAWFSDALVLRTGACAQLLVLEIPCIDLDLDLRSVINIWGFRHFIWGLPRD